MDASATIEKSETESFAVEFQRVWVALPDKVVFGVLLASWLLLFHFLGWSTTAVGKTSSLFEWMYSKWRDPIYDSSQGMYVPFVVLALLWHRRKILEKSVSGDWWPALGLLGLAIVLHIVGFLVQQPRLSVMALFSGIYALVGVVWGGKALKAVFFPFFLFAFCVPLGGTFAQSFTLPLRVFMAKIVAFITVNILDIPVIRQGTQLLDAHRGIVDPLRRWNFDVAPECSGIRSLIALLAITTTLSVLKFRTWWKRAVIIVLTLPLVIFCNVLRLCTIIVMSAAFSWDAGRLTDKYFGYVTYGVAIVCVLLAARWLKEETSEASP